MSATKRSLIPVLTAILCLLPNVVIASLSRDAVAEELGWINNSAYFCGGYYLEEPFSYLEGVDNTTNVKITSNAGFIAMRGTSVLEKEVTITRQGQQITANRAFLYRDPVTWKLSSTDMIGDVHLREPNTLVVGKRGHYDFVTSKKSLIDILYRTTLNRQAKLSASEMDSERYITALTAWGTAYEFSQSIPRVYDFSSTTFSTCPPRNPSWEVKAGHIELNKNTGRGYATHARLYIKNIPVLYMPYFNFSIDKQRKTGFLWPTIGLNGNWGPYFLAPFYWNIAPNYDMTLTPAILTKRGVQFTDDFRYLTHAGRGALDFSVIPHDRAFAQFQNATRQDPAFAHSNNPDTEAEFNRLENDNTMRTALVWRDDSHLGNHWSSHVDFNYASDDYYLKDFGSNLNETTANQLLQEADLYYKGQNWNFTGRLQAYQTLHPISLDVQVANQYRRFPQIIWNGDYPNQAFGLEFFIYDELTHFDIRNTPGTQTNLPIGNRISIQPGVSLPFSLPYFYITPRLQLSMRQYQLYQTTPTNTPGSKHRVIPIFDIASGLSLTRDMSLFRNDYHQTLELQTYYTYIPYRNQVSIPIFDTTVSTLTYDQIFTYNRFSGIDRIGDANQIALGVTTRLIDQNSGLEKVRLGVGDIVYFADRKVTYCNNQTCTDNPSNPNNTYRVSPLSAVLDYHVNSSWSFTANTIWNMVSKQMDNSTVNLRYQPDNDHILNLGFTFARNGDYFSGINVDTSENNLKLTDISFAWPLMSNINAVGRWTEDWNTHHFQNILYGLQYDTCCWAVRLVGGRTFTGLEAETKTPGYTNALYLQFDLKGLGNIGTGNPGGLLSTINGYKNQFGQETT